jgi:hypothetical protein
MRLRVFAGSLLPAVLLLSGLVVAGCGGTYRASRPARQPMEETERIVYKNLDLKASVGVLDMSEARAGNMLQARLKLKNMVGKTINAEIKIKFVDKDGYELGNPAPWQPLILESGEVRSFEQVASSDRAVSFNVIIQRAGSH